MENMNMSAGVPLPFPTRRLTILGRSVDEYIIPPDQKGEVLRKLYPFVPVPSLNTVMLDIHEDKRFKVGEFRVLRGADMDWLVSPYFQSSGGTVLDWLEDDGECCAVRL